MNRTRLVLIPLMAAVLAASILGVAVAGRAGPAGPPPPARLTAKLGRPMSQTAGTGFTYQGQLLNAGSPANGPYDFQFGLWDSPSNGYQVGVTLTLLNQTVHNGLFTVQLDFGTAAFSGPARWLEVATRPAGSGGYTLLTPRQPLTPAPYAITAQTAQTAPWLGISGKPAGFNPLRLPNTFTTAASGIDNSRGGVASTIGPDGLGLVAYDDYANQALVLDHCRDIVCSVADLVAIVDTGIIPEHSMTLGADGMPILSYLSVVGNVGTVKVAHCNDPLCGSLQTHILGAANASLGAHPAIAIGGDGFAVVAYADLGSQQIMLAHCANAACTTSDSPVQIDYNIGSSGSRPSIALGGDGGLLVSYTINNAQTFTLKVSHCRLWSTCSPAVTLDTNSGYWTSLVIGNDGLGLIGYAYAGDLKTAHCNDQWCNGAILSVARHNPTESLNFPSISVGADGLAVMSYFDDFNALLGIAHCANPACSVTTDNFVDPIISTSGFPEHSLTIGVDGLPLIGYKDTLNGLIKVVHCGSPACQSYQHRR